MADARPARSSGTRDLLRLPDFRRLWLAQAISHVGDGMTYLALFLVVLDQTGSAAAVALMSILVALPPVTIGLVAGAWADRADRRRIMVASDAVRAVVVLALIPAVIAGSLPLVFLLATIQAVIGTFFAPARTAMLPRVVPEDALLAANSLGQMTHMVAMVLGTTATGVIVGIGGSAWPVFAIDALSFLASAALVLRVSPAAGRPAGDGSRQVAERGMAGAVADGLRVIARSAPLTAAVGGIAVSMLGIGAINVLFVPFLVDELGASPAWAGPLDGVQAVAMVLAGGLLTAVGARVSVPGLLVGGLAGVSVSVAGLAVAPGPIALVPVLFAAGLFVMPVQAATMTIVQQGTTDTTRGRVAGALQAAIQAASIGSMALAGILAEVIGMRWVFAGAAMIAMVAALVAWALFRRAPVTVIEPSRPAAPESARPAGTVEAGDGLAADEPAPTAA